LSSSVLGLILEVVDYVADLTIPLAIGTPSF